MNTKRSIRLLSITAACLALATVSPRSSEAFWPSAGGGSGNDRAVATAVGPTGEVYAVGRFEGTATFGDVTLRSEGLGDIFVVKYGLAGGVEWVVAAGGVSEDRALDVTVDDSGNAYVVGTIHGTVRFGGVSVPGHSDGAEDGFLARVDADGSWRWVLLATGPEDDELTSAGFLPGDPDAVPPVPGRIIVGGSYRCDITFGSYSLNQATCPSGRDDPVVAAVDPDGDVHWLTDGGGAYPSSVRIVDLSVAPDGTIYVAARGEGKGHLAGYDFWGGRTAVHFGEPTFVGDSWTLEEWFPAANNAWILPWRLDNSREYLDFYTGITLPATGTPVLAFIHGRDGDPGNDVAGILEISVDGNAYQNIVDAGGVFLEGGYDTHLSDPGHPFDGQNVWLFPAGGTTHWVRIDLSAFRGHAIAFRWNAGTKNPGGVIPYWAIDHVSIVDTSGGRRLFFADMEDHPRGLVAALTNGSGSSPTWAWVHETSLAWDLRAIDASSGNPVVLGKGVPSPDNFVGPVAVQLWPAGDMTPDGTILGELRSSGDQWNWGQRLEGAEPGDVTRDADGNVYLVGSFDGTRTYGTETLTSTGAHDIVAASFDAAGNWRWATGGDTYDAADRIPGRSGGPEEDWGLGISIGTSGLYIGGSFRGTAVFGDDEQVVSAGGDDAVALELDTEGHWFNAETWIVGQEVVPPPGAYVGSETAVPDLYIDGREKPLADYFFWSPPIPSRPEGKLYALVPLDSVELRWRRTSDLSDPSRVVSVGQVVWPADRCQPSSTGACYQVHVTGAPVELIPDDNHLSILGLKLPAHGSSAAVIKQSVFHADQEGWAVVEYVEHDTPDATKYPVTFEVVRTFDFANAPDFADNVPWQIGTPITEAFHDEPGRTGYVVNEKAFYDGVGGQAAYDRQARTGQIVPVNRVNPNRTQDQDKEMVVVWYRRNHNRVYWGERPMRYSCYWPLDPDVIIVASELGGEVRGQTPLDSVNYPGAFIYHQDDPNLPGYNPNDEHAMFFPSNAGTGMEAVFALRADFGRELDPHSTDASDPYVVVKYQNPSGGWGYRIYKVLATSPDYQGFSFPGVAGDRVQPPYPLSLLPGCEETRIQGQNSPDDPVPPPFFKDVHEELWAAAEGEGNVLYAYPLEAGFFYDLNGDDVPDASTGQCIPWMARLPESLGGTASPHDPIAVHYTITWPSDVPLLEAGESLFKPKRGLPDIYDQAAVEVIYDQEWETQRAGSTEEHPDWVLAQVVKPFEPRRVSLDAVPLDIATETDDDGNLKILGSSDGTIRLPVTLRKRLRYETMDSNLTLRGLFDDSEAGEPLVMLDVMSNRERDQLLALSNDEDWQDAVWALYRLSRNPNGVQTICTNVDRVQLFGVVVGEECAAFRPVTDDDILIGWKDDNQDGLLETLRALGGHPALTAGGARSGGYVTVAFNNDPSLGDLPVSLEVIRVGCLEYPEPPADPEIVAPYQGEVKVLLPDNVFDESVTLHFNGDFGGWMDKVEFQWFYHPDEDGTPPEPLPDPEHGQLNGWIEVPVSDPRGAQDVTIGGANLQTLSDNWYVVRYRGLGACDNETKWSLWTGQPGSTPLDPRGQLVEGWVKRVEEGLNPFEARVRDFHKAATNTYASMIEQLGPRYEGDIALNPSAENLNSIGLIEAYETVLHRAKMLSIDGTPPVDYGPANNEILNVTSRIADFYKLLGDEAFADAEDPTVGITTDEVQFGIGSLAPSIFNFENQVPNLLQEELVLLRGRDGEHENVTAPPVYNRFYWNFTGGNGEVAYTLSYDIQDINLDGFIDAKDAKIQFPQGHGDAWGHLLTAMTHYYDLLRHPYFTWVPRPEAVLVAGIPVQADYYDERKFAKVAAQRALTGSRIVELTYKNAYTEDPEGQWQGYKDTDRQRAWGLDGWGRRSGMAVYFDWVTGNAILPDVDPNPEHTGIEKIDRTTVLELDEIIAHAEAIQAEMDAADRGLNPLGLARGVVPFDIDPAQVDQGKTHFEQVYDRAAQALDSAVQVWDYANELNRMLRFNQDDVQKMRVNAHSTETDFKNRLIEIFGYPYSDDIGPGKTYPDGYDGPDLYHYMYVDGAELAGTGIETDEEKGGRVTRFTAKFEPMESGIGFANLDKEAEGDLADFCNDYPMGDGCSLGDPQEIKKRVEYVAWSSKNGHFMLIKPPEWTGRRRATGKIQEAIAQMLSAQIALEKAITEYNALRGDIQDQVNQIAETANIRAEQIEIVDEDKEELSSLDTRMLVEKGLALVGKVVGKSVEKTFEISADCIPRNEIAGTADGGDVLSVDRCSVKEAGNVISIAFSAGGAIFEEAAEQTETEKAAVERQGALKLRRKDVELEDFTLKNELTGLLRQEPVRAMEIYARAQQLKQAEQAYFKALAEGERLLSRLMTSRKNTAAAVQEYRYEDMAFRIFRNDALQKYHAMFDMAARYTYLAASAYDYDTNLLGTDGKAGRKFLTDIVKQRSLGQVLDHEPVPGTPGLADAMGKMKLNFEVLKGQMGFDNPALETDRISLRHELFRLKDDADGDAAWREKLEAYRVDDLWSVPEFRRFMRPFAPESAGPQPAIVIPFTTTVSWDLDLFGWPLGPGDHAFDSSRFATRIRGLGVWFDGYDALSLSATPRVYLVPVGDDYLRAPTNEPDQNPVRQWKVIDQILPVPYPLNTDELAQAGWTPLADALSGSFGDIRRYSAFRAYADTDGEIDDNELAMDTRLISRSVWNSQWLLVIPGAELLSDADQALDTFIEGQELPDGSGRDGNGVRDIEIVFETYSYEGLK